MNKEKKEKVVRGLLKCGYKKEDISDAIISNLDSTKINNLIELGYIELNDALSSNKKIIFDMLNSKYFIYDIKLINSTESYYNIIHLINYAKSDAGKNSKYHENDMKLIANASEEKICEYLYSYAIRKELSYHEEDMNAIFEAKDRYMACWTYEYAINKNVQDSKYHLNDIELIKNANSPKISHYLYNCATSLVSLNSDKHENDMKMINDAKDDYIAKYLSFCACDFNSINSKYHDIDMKLISNAANHIIAKCLYECAVNKDSLSSYRHENDMNLINKMDSSIARYLKICIASSIILAVISIPELIRLFSNIKDEEIAKKTYRKLLENVEEKETKYVDDDIKMFKAKVLK